MQALAVADRRRVSIGLIVFENRDRSMDIIDRPLLAVPSCNDDGQLLMYNVSVADEGDEEPTMALEMRQFPCSFAGHKCWALAVSGSSILALTHTLQDTVVYDTVACKAAALGPRLHDYKPATPAMLPVGDDTVVVMNTVLPGPVGFCSFEALRRNKQLRPGDDGDGVWRAFPLPEPPLDIERGRSGRVSAYLALGSRLWISVTGKGTFSLDVVNGGGSWRREGTWELPLYNRAMFVPELGSVIGITLNRGSTSHGGHCLCALDMEVRPPALRHVWEETFPSECLQAGHVPWHHMVSLAHLGDGAFCVCRPVNVERDARGYFTRNAISFMAVQLRRRLPGTGTGTGGELELTRRGKVRYCGEWVRGCPFPWFIQP